MAKKKIFISYDYDNDRHYKNLLVAWDANKRFDFKFRDHSADVSINSIHDPAIKSVISRYINQGSTFLVIIGKKSYRSNWIKWEIMKAVELGKKIVAVKTERTNISPNELLGIGASWAMSFTHESIVRAISNS